MCRCSKRLAAARPLLLAQQGKAARRTGHLCWLASLALEAARSPQVHGHPLSLVQGQLPSPQLGEAKGACLWACLGLLAFQTRVRYRVLHTCAPRGLTHPAMVPAGTPKPGTLVTPSGPSLGGRGARPGATAVTGDAALLAAATAAAPPPLGTRQSNPIRGAGPAMPPRSDSIHAGSGASGMSGGSDVEGPRAGMPHNGSYAGGGTGSGMIGPERGSRLRETSGPMPPPSLMQPPSSRRAPAGLVSPGRRQDDEVVGVEASLATAQTSGPASSSRGSDLNMPEA